MLIGLTGGIGSGKTTVAKLFETLGCSVYNSDEKAKALYYNPDIKKAVCQLLGNKAYLNETEIDKNFIAEKVFKNEPLLNQLNSIIHPAVKEDFIQFKNKLSHHSFIIKETAILFEAGINKDLDFSILVTAPTELKIHRVLKRSGISKAEIEARMKAQWSDEKKTPMANFVITNDDQSALIPQVQTILKKLKQHA